MVVKVKDNDKLIRLLVVVVIFTSLMSSMKGGNANTGGTMTYSGRLLKSSPCVFLNTAPADIEFGDVQVRDLNESAGKYQKIISLAMRCKGGTTKVGVRHLGTATSFNNAAVMTNIDGLGIELSLIDKAGMLQPFIVGAKLMYFTGRESSTSEFDINLVMTTVPFKDPNKHPQVGPFNATSTIQLEYP
ncbi:hypothetical protein SME23J_37100 [Serratia marcescens]|nr:hypothetical protein SME23J_37100 [Serratia marcescens]